MPLYNLRYSRFLSLGGQKPLERAFFTHRSAQPTRTTTRTTSRDATTYGNYWQNYTRTNNSTSVSSFVAKTFIENLARSTTRRKRDLTHQRSLLLLFLLWLSIPPIRISFTFILPATYRPSEALSSSRVPSTGFYVEVSFYLLKNYYLFVLSSLVDRGK